MARRGRKRRLEIEAEYWRLLAAGVGTVDACKQLGIGRKTGYRWRAESGGLPPVVLPEASRSGRYLSLLERKRIATLRERGLGVRDIAERLGRAPSTISRELRRNSLPHDRGVYDADLAHHRSLERGGRPRRVKLAADPELKAEVQARLDLEWSPEQIAAHLRALWPDRPERHLCHESIYRALYQGARGGLSRTLTRKLRTGRPLRKKRRRSDQRAARFAAPAVLIDRRPQVVELRSRLGDWEGDLIVGPRSQSAVATLVDRRTRYLLLVALPDGHSADHLRDALVAALGALPNHARRTLTWDQGSEMARHHELAPYFTDGVFLAHPGSPWQRGTNENTNGLIRQYLPKRTNLSLHTPDDLRVIEDRLNNRPRKTLGWQTPALAFAAALTP
ncbi:IS30 family transposase (plasmid) [Embleya sp. NBC_00888]|uniref:IS30 family transposase n=1 Tax=Embleya sp. NBC_00888 TaxID=2975960 RepID=UPI002F90F0A6|nr:IS30 family transposase [Embleya sp. NBC_00888]WSY48442.1 IS30 family transposase [Embleya sp. NBC_00888]